jgi:hypothetical protein
MRNTFSCIRHHIQGLSRLILLIPSNQNPGSSWEGGVHLGCQPCHDGLLDNNPSHQFFWLSLQCKSRFRQLAAVSERIAVASKEGKSMLQEQQFAVLCQLVFLLTFC